MKKINGREARPVIEARQDFQGHGSFRGEQGSAASLGILPDEFRASALRASYVVYSYSTPIAWVDGDVWVRPDVKYSVTTSHHQGRCPMSGTSI